MKAKYINIFSLFIKSQKGATAIEYAVIGSLMSIAIAGTVYSIGGTLENNFYSSLGSIF